MPSTLKKHSSESRKSLNTLKQTNRNKPRHVRSFSVLKVNGKNVSGEEKGRFLAKNPKEAASKAFSRWCRDNNKKSKCSTNIIIYETTRGNPHKQYSYNASRRTHSTNVDLEGTTVNYKYVNKLYTTDNVSNLRASPSK